MAFDPQRPPESPALLPTAPSAAGACGNWVSALSPSARAPAHLSGSSRQTAPMRPSSPALPPTQPLAPPAQLPARSGIVAQRPPRRPAPPKGRFSFLRSLRWRLALGFVGFLTVALVLLGAFLYLTIRPYLRGEALTRLQETALRQFQTNHSKFESDVQINIGQVTPAFEESIGGAIGGLTDVEQVLMIDPATNQVVAGHPGSQIGQPPPYYTQARLLELLKQSVNQNARTLTYQPPASGIGVVLIGFRCAACTSLSSTGRVAVIEVITDFNSVNAVINRLMVYIALGMSVLVMLALLAGAPLVGRALRPLTRMTTTAQAIAAGDLSQRVNLPHRGDEIGELSSSFDEMIDHIQAAFAAQQESEAHMRQFVADASHELRTPLTSLRGFTDVLLRGAKDDPATAEHVLHAMQRESERMSRLVHDLLTLARLDAGRQLSYQQFDLVTLVGEAVDQARILAGERVVTMRTDGGGPLLLVADQDKIKQVLLILLDNALKYGKQGSDGWVRVQVSRSADLAQLQVIDNGRGINAEDLPHIFERFYRADKTRSRSGHTNQMPAWTARGEAESADAQRPQAVQAEGPQAPAAGGAGAASNTGVLKAMNAGGSGLGLPIALAIVQAHGGSIWAHSQLGQGTQFTIRLPRQPHTPQNGR